jgi:precorrin-6A/cobalt-precorrin-6A reductase
MSRASEGLGAASRPLRVLLLGGSTEASALARQLASTDGYDVTVSYAGRTRERVETPGRVRVGGFGGIDGLVRHLLDEQVDVLVDATHPFAAVMPHHVARACGLAGIPGLRVRRPPWEAVVGDTWHDVSDLEAAADAIEALGARRVFLTTGRQELAPFARARGVWFLVRAIEPPHPMPLAQATVILARGPFLVESERALMIEHRIDIVVSKNSGGTAAAAKLAAARELGLPVVMVARPDPPALPYVATVTEALDWLTRTVPVPTPGQGVDSALAPEASPPSPAPGAG